MIRLHHENVNTPEAYDAMYGGHRRIEMSAVVPLQVLLPMLMHNGFWALDLGCGVGQYYPYLQGADHVTGIDFAPASADEALKTHDYLEVLCQDFSLELPFDESVFDVVFCSEVLEHMESPQHLVDEIHRVLKPGGSVIATVPYRDCINIVEHLWAFDEDDMRTLFTAFTIATHFRFSVGLGDHFEHFLMLARK